MTEKKTGHVQLLVRMSAKIKQALEKMAADERRSQNSQTIVLLEDGLRKAGYLKDKK